MGGTEALHNSPGGIEKLHNSLEGMAKYPRSQEGSAGMQITNANTELITSLCIQQWRAMVDLDSQHPLKPMSGNYTVYTENK